MAIKIDSNDTRYGFKFKDCYCRITEWRGTKEETTFKLSYFVTKEARDVGYESVKEELFIMNHSDAPSLADMYNHIKSIPEYQSAEDC